MPKSDRIIAVDIGASKVVVAEFLRPKAGAPQMTAYGISRLGIEAESETDPSAYIVAAIRDILREQKIRPAPMAMTISGQAVFPRYVKLPPVSRDKLYQIISYEAEQNVPFPIDEVVWDYQLIGQTEAEEQMVMLVAVKTENVARLADCALAAGLEPEIVDVAPLALYNVVRFNYPDLQGCTMVLDVGARSSNLIFVEEKRIFSRSIPVAGNAITQELMKEFNLSFADAEALKREHGFVAFGGVYAGPENAVADRVSKIIRSVVTRLHAEVNRSINFYRSQQGGNPPSLVLMAGGSSTIPHFDTFFREKLKTEVGFLNPFINITVAESLDEERVGEDLHLLGEVAGLALRQTLTCPVEINLMPPMLESRKTFRRRQPFFALAAVGLVLIMLCWWAYFFRMREMLSKRVETVVNKSGALKELLQRIGKIDAEKKAVGSKAESLIDVIRLRSQWAEMLDAMHSCLLDGMWLTQLSPVVENGMVTQIEISGRGFLDKLKGGAETTAIEEFRNRLRAQSAFFTQQTMILLQPPVNQRDYAQSFQIRIVLKNPIKLK